MEEMIITEEDEQGIQEEEVPYCDVQLSARESMKASVLVKKQRAARFRKALWQNLMKKQEVQHQQQQQKQPARRTTTLRPSSSPPRPAPRLSPDITSSTNYRYSTGSTPAKISTPTHSQMKSSSTSSESDSDESEREMDKGQESDASSESSVKSMHESSLILSNQGDPIVSLDASVVEDFIRSGKPIRAAALAALEAVHGKKFTDSEALQQLRKVYTMKPSVPKGRGRRTIAKRSAGKPTRAPPATNWCRTCESLMYRNCYYQLGDIVRVDAGRKFYFLQIQTLIKDWREGAYASMVWLTPKKGFKHRMLPFNPRNFNLRRDIPCLDSALDDVTHVMHLPTDYFDGHPSFWQPRPGMVYMRLGEPLVEFRPLEQPNKVENGIKLESSSQPEQEADSSNKEPSTSTTTTTTTTDTDQVNNIDNNVGTVFSSTSSSQQDIPETYDVADDDGNRQPSSAAVLV